MNVAIAGASGFVGTALIREFHKRQWSVAPVDRSEYTGDMGPLIEKLSRADAVINLAGAPILARWTTRYKQTLHDSRVKLTAQLVKAMGQAQRKPHVFVSTSAVGIYSAEDTHTESNYTYANDFLGQTALQWEQAAGKAADAATRTVIMRLGIVLGPGGGALKKMLLPFSMGLGGNIGSGRQPLSWVHIDDLVAAYVAAITNDSMSGVYNLAAPRPATNGQLTLAVANALNRPAFITIPPIVLRLLYGDGADALTGGQRALPQRLLDMGFEFSYTELRQAVQHCLRQHTI